MLSVEPILDLTFFRSGMGAAAASGAREPLSEPGDLGEERTTATFFTLLISALDEGDLGVPGLLSPLWVSVLGEVVGQKDHNRASGTGR